MHVSKVLRFESSEDEQSDEEMSEDPSVNESEGEEEEEEEEEEELVEEGDDDDGEDVKIPYPTPPPDGDQESGSATSKMAKKSNAKMAVATKEKINPKTSGLKKSSVRSQCIEAIKALNNRSGSSVIAIVTYIKSTGYEIANMERLPKMVLSALKMAIEKGEVVQKKRSFKLSENAMKISKAVEKMKENEKKKKQKEKEKIKGKKTAESKKGKANTDSAAMMPEKTANSGTLKPRKKKPTERSSKQPVKKKANVGAGGKAQLKVTDAVTGITEESKKNAKGKSKALPKESNEPKLNGSRKSIGTLAKTNSRPKIKVKAIKKLVSGNRSVDNPDADEMDTLPEDSSTPKVPAKKKRMVK